MRFIRSFRRDFGGEPTPQKPLRLKLDPVLLIYAYPEAALPLFLGRYDRPAYEEVHNKP